MATDTSDKTKQQALLNDQPVIALPSQCETLVRITVDNDLEIEQQDPQDTETDRVLVAEQNIGDFLACIVHNFERRHGQEATADLLDRVCDAVGGRDELWPETITTTYFGEPLKRSEPPGTSRSEPPPERSTTNADRQRRYRDRKRNAEGVTHRNAHRNGAPDRNAAPLQHELPSS
ncbi:hypothetical protein GWE18_07465 [Bradyrhizobium sp. CSA112]|uniref:hypothetical protein n=1 Tax=Bradyrhizobium sp. CSA112 TaxID=2699170 RepID=UPI0023B05668|nr:hypothetical protein [Bradyrhizobium sp. CSA112]MDE5452712.1 hypothetical protein [Bradyrhizobium sp. CSA112]